MTIFAMATTCRGRVGFAPSGEIPPPPPFDVRGGCWCLPWLLDETFGLSVAIFESDRCEIGMMYMYRRLRCVYKRDQDV